MPKVSVLMPVYNTKEEYLREAIESILNQTFTDYEFIILNDGSTNNAEEVILSYKDSRIKYHKQENQGLPKTRNNLMDLANGEYLAWADSDDIQFPTRIEKHVKVLDEMPNIGMVSNWFRIKKLERTINLPKNPRFLDFTSDNMVAQPSITLRAKVFKGNNLRYNENFKCAEDYDLWARAMLVTEVYNVQEVLLDYRWHETNISQLKAERQLKEAISVKERLLNMLTADKTLQEKIKFLIYESKNKSEKWYQKIFSIKNSYVETVKYKQIRLLFMKFKIPVNSTQG